VKKLEQNRLMLAGVLVISAMSMIGLVDNLIKYIAEDGSLWQFHFIRSIIVCTIIVIFTRVYRLNLKPNSLFAVATRSFFGASSMIMYFGALSFIPIAEAGAGLFTAPIFVLIISSLYFKVRVGVWRILAVSIGFLGVLFVLKPDVGELSYFSFLPLLAGFFYGLLGLTTRYLCPNESTEVLTFGFFAALGIYGLLGLLYFTIFPAIGETSFLTKGFVWPNAKFNLIIISQALVSVVGVALITRSYQVAEASYVSVFEYTFLLSAGFWGYMLFGEMLDLTAILGVTFIVLAGIIILFRGT
tara:strand:+ start:510 stop:1409 length:900 start_codon:yes stop_codon:yes gene_type:complete